MRVTPPRTATAHAITLVGACLLTVAAVLVSAAQVRPAHGNAAFTPSLSPRANGSPSEPAGGEGHAATHDPTSAADPVHIAFERWAMCGESTRPDVGAPLVTAKHDAGTSRAGRERLDALSRGDAAEHDARTSEGRRKQHDVRPGEAVWALESMPPGEMAQASDPYHRLPEVTFFDRNSKQSMRCRLYAAGGVLDEDSALRLDLLLADQRDPKVPRVGRLDRRLLQLLFRAAYHFEVDTIEVVSAYREQGSRRRREGLHGLARAIDFAVPGVKPEELASYLRQHARVGVGIYTHRRTRFVHLDVRDHSYHWLDASPPRRTWRGLSIGNRTLPQRDAAYDARNDWPEGLPTPTECRVRVTQATDEKGNSQPNPVSVSSVR